LEAGLVRRAAVDPGAVIATETKAELLPPRDSEEALVTADAAARSLNGTESESINVWPDETAEAAFMAEARERGEPIATVPVRAVPAEENESRNLPPLETLVNRIPADVRETLDDLFRVKFVGVRRVPAKSLKG
jgi:hypothetical protein